jgi:arylformamidase
MMTEGSQAGAGGVHEAEYDVAGSVGLAVRDARNADWDQRSERLRRRIPHQGDLAYGPGGRQRLDWVPCGQPGAPTLAWIHGGWWQRNEKERSFHLATGILPNGLNFANLEYTLAPQATIDAMIDEVRTAVRWLGDRLASLGADPNRLLIGGHSAGGHLAVMAMGERGVRGGMVIGGLYDLEPIRHLSHNELLGLDAEAARRLSPVVNLPAAAGSLVIAVGSDDLPAFRAQSSAMHRAWTDGGLEGELIEVPGANHFTVLEALADPAGVLAARLAGLAGRT